MQVSSDLAVVFSTSSSSTRYRTESNHCINSQWQTWSRKITGLRCYAVDMLMWAVPGELSAWRTDRQTDGFSGTVKDESLANYLSKKKNWRIYCTANLKIVNWRIKVWRISSIRQTKVSPNFRLLRYIDFRLVHWWKLSQPFCKVTMYGLT